MRRHRGGDKINNLKRVGSPPPSFSTMEITDNTLIVDLLREYPETIAILAQNGIVSLSCPMERWQKLGDVARKRDIIVDELVEELRRAVEERFPKKNL